MKKILIAGLLLGLIITLMSPSVVVRQSAYDLPTINIGFGDAAYASYVALDFVVSGTSNHDVQVQNALDSLPADYGGTVYIWWGDYQFNSQVLRAIDNVIIQGVGAATHIDLNGSTPVFSAGTQSNWLFKNISVDAGGVTDDDGLVDDSDNNYRVEMWVNGVWTHDIGSGVGGGGNCTEVIKTVTGDSGSYSASDCDGSIQIAGGSGLVSGVSGAVLTMSADATLTRDTEWDTIGEIEAATSVNIIISTEIDSEAELEALVADVSDFFTDNDLIPEANLDIANAPTDEYSLTWEADDGKPRWQLVTGGGGGNCSTAIVTFGGDSGSDYTAGDCSGAIAVITGADLSSVSDGAGNVTITADSSLTRDAEWDTIGEIEAATSVNIIISTEIDSEAELEALLADVSNLIIEAEIDSEAEIEAIIGDNLLVDGELDSEAELEALLADVSNVFTNNDTIPEGNIHADITRDAEWDTEAEVEAAWSDNIIVDGEIDTEAELEALVGDVTNIYTDNDGDPIFETELDSEAELEAQLADTSDVLTNNDSTNYTLEFAAESIRPDISNGPVQTLHDGTNWDYWVLKFPHDSTTRVFIDLGLLPSSYTDGNITVEIRWVADATSGGVEWDIYTAGIGDSEDSDPALGGPDATITETVDGNTRQTNYSQSSSFNPGWSDDDWCQIAIERDHDDGDDTMEDHAEMTWVIISWPSKR